MEISVAPDGGVAVGVERGAYSETKQIDELVLSETTHALKDVASNFGVVVTSICECYSVLASSRDPSFREMRGQVARATVDYTNMQLPKLSEVVSGLKRIVQYYEDMDEDIFASSMEGIAEEVAELKPIAEEVSQGTTTLVEALNRHHKQAVEITAKLRSNFEAGTERASVTRSRQAKAHHEGQPATSTTKSGSDASTTAAFPRLSRIIAGYGSGRSSPATSDRKELWMIAEEEQAKLDLSTAQMIEKILFPALRRFTEAENQVTGFLSVLEKVVKELSKTANNSTISSHLTIMGNGRKGIVDACNEYIKTEVSTKATIGALSTLLERGVDSEPNYISKWFNGNLHQPESAIASPIELQLSLSAPCSE